MPALLATGPRYWRSLDELADTPEFRQWVENEFPAGAPELIDPVNRRHFMKIMSASFLLAGLGLTGCRRPVSNILPFSKQPEGYLHGVPQYYATSMPSRGGAIPLVVKSNDGRPTKVEGNALHPEHNGSTDRYAQASVLDLYDPDRAMHFKQAGKVVTQPVVLDFLSGLSRELAGKDGEGLCFLLERSGSPSRARVQKLVSERFPKAKWFVYEPVDFDIHREAATLAFGKPVRPSYRLEQAKRIVALDCDFLGAEEDLQRLIRDFARGRKIESPDKAKAEDLINRLYVVESLMTLTGINAERGAAGGRGAGGGSHPAKRRRARRGIGGAGQAVRWRCQVDFGVREGPAGACGQMHRGGGAAATSGGARVGPCHERRVGQPGQDRGLP
jgi:molybdopterin-containing oxidoreductase family iron-sulfur binding subunit